MLYSLAETRNLLKTSPNLNLYGLPIKLRSNIERVLTPRFWEWKPKLEINDYIRLKDIYEKLIERDHYNDNNALSEYKLKELNRELLDLIQNALYEIEWKKYTNNRIHP